MRRVFESLRQRGRRLLNVIFHVDSRKKVARAN